MSKPDWTVNSYEQVINSFLVSICRRAELAFIARQIVLWGLSAAPFKAGHKATGRSGGFIDGLCDICEPWCMFRPIAWTKDPLIMPSDFDPFILELPFFDPIDAFAPLARKSFAQLLHSVPGAAGGGRYTFLVVDPFDVLVAKGDTVSVSGRRSKACPFSVLRKTLAQYQCDTVTDLPPFQGGAVGCFSYELVQHLERIDVAVEDDLNFPDMAVGFYDVVVSFDWLKRQVLVISTGLPCVERRDRADRAHARAHQMRDLLTTPSSVARDNDWTGFASPSRGQFRSDYMDNVATAIDYIFSGDIYQANLSQRFDMTLPKDFEEFALFERLCQVSPVSFAAFQNLPGVTIASNSPERFLKISDPSDGRRVESRPIKGTIGRAQNQTADLVQQCRLKESQKDQAENIMIVDLVRNDLSKVCDDHSIAVTGLCDLESYAGVHHLVSTVTGRLREECDPIDLLMACFPGGSVTGAPKPRAMAIIAELEGRARGPYCGAIGYIGFDGSMDTNIAIRTLCIASDNTQIGRRAYFQVGGGIVADSDPIAEYEESLVKAQAFLAAIAPSPAVPQRLDGMPGDQ